MSNAKYNWEQHMPRMIQLYYEGKSVSDIHAAIQDPANGFDPKPRRVYDVLSEAGYPTKPKERKEFLRRYRSEIWQNNPATIEYPSHDSNLPFVALPSNDAYHLPHMTSAASTSRNTTTVRDLNLPFVPDLESSSNHLNDNGGHQDYDLSQGHPNENDPGPSDGLMGLLDWLEDESTTTDDEGCISTRFEIQCDQVLGPSLQPHLYASMTRTLQQHSTANIKPQLVGEPVPGLHSGLAIATSTSTHEKRKTSEESSTEHYASTRPPSTLSSNPHPSTEVARITSSSSTFSTRFSTILPSRFRPGRSSSPNKRASNPTRDSGYASGRSSPFPVLEESDTNEQFPEEFKALYRVRCSRHEPQRASTSSVMPVYELRPPDQYRDVTTCSKCLYSAIHNLSWSARYLKVQVFQSELRLDSLYDIKGLDVVGNSALHYAAAGGADSEYFVSLIQAGVNPYQLNTEGQLFLHCLHPNETAGRDSLELLSINLVNILNYLNYLDSKATSASLHWRDNEGRTVLDVVATHMPDATTKSQTFQLIQNAGYPLKLSREFLETDFRSLSSSNRNNRGTGDDFSTTQNKQRKAYEILVCAMSDQPNYVDPETGDNVLHALARLKLPEKGSVLSKVKEFVSRDVDLNLHNRDRHSPLAAFIQERPFLGIESEETGATMSKYLDALLWKDIRQRVPNKINVNMRNKEGAPALYYATVRSRPDSVRSLIEGRANVNARVQINGVSLSILQATLNARSGHVNDAVKMHLYNNVISYLEHEGAVPEPTLLQERRFYTHSVRVMPM
ncbi:hypothetical protein BDZ45DRAFT_739937 [Acephala macrosclerotiorum]|nr:hypothetical protein BDZ45DRAFT_739937 [Acephala macrosclerotiorum]